MWLHRLSDFWEQSHLARWLLAISLCIWELTLECCYEVKVTVSLSQAGHDWRLSESSPRQGVSLSLPSASSFDDCHKPSHPPGRSSVCLPHSVLSVFPRSPNSLCVCVCCSLDKHVANRRGRDKRESGKKSWQKLNCSRVKSDTCFKEPWPFIILLCRSCVCSLCVWVLVAVMRYENYNNSLCWNSIISAEKFHRHALERRHVVVMRVFRICSWGVLQTPFAGL